MKIDGVSIFEKRSHDVGAHITNLDRSFLFHRTMTHSLIVRFEYHEEECQKGYAVLCSCCFVLTF